MVWWNNFANNCFVNYSRFWRKENLKILPYIYLSQRPTTEESIVTLATKHELMRRVLVARQNRNCPFPPKQYNVSSGFSNVTVTKENALRVMTLSAPFCLANVLIPSFLFFPHPAIFMPFFTGNWSRCRVLWRPHFVYGLSVSVSILLEFFWIACFEYFFVAYLLFAR